MIRIDNLKVPLSYDKNTLLKLAAGKLGVGISHIRHIEIFSRTVNDGDKDNIYFDMSVALSVDVDEESIEAFRRDKDVSRQMKYVYYTPKWKTPEKRPVVVGFGPAGIFAALVLAQSGARPIVLERGLDVDSRRERVARFFKGGALDRNTNVQFGEGGAGAFSDGKLKIGAKDFRKMKVLSEFVLAGAPEEILYLAKPHIGTDNLYKAVKNLRKKIISLGGEVRFGAALTKILKKDGRITGVGYEKDGRYDEIYSDSVVLAIGHSARDTFEALLSQGVCMEPKNIAVGVRIEHPQSYIDRLRYGRFAGNPALGAANYKMVSHLKNGRGVYTFCMCPGGTVVAATSDTGCVVTNGMSEFARDGRNANSAILVTVGKNDFGGSDALCAVKFQREIEKAAFAAGGGNYRAPAQRLEDFLKDRPTKAFGEVLPTYLPGTSFAKVDSYLPGFIADSLRLGILEMDKWLCGYSFPDAVITGAETRSSSPVKIKRKDGLEADGISGLYPCGEGAGYAGGIISAAVDGMLCAEHILNNCNE